MPSASRAPALDDTSNASVMPAGGVHVAPLANECDVTIMSLAAVVVTLGAAWLS